MSSAGNIGYYDRRPGVDLLGKSDRVIARRRPVYVELGTIWYQRDAPGIDLAALRRADAIAH